MEEGPGSGFELSSFSVCVSVRSDYRSSESPSEGECFFLGALFRFFRGAVPLGGSTTPSSFLRNSSARGRHLL